MDPMIFLVIASYFLVFGVGFIAGRIAIPISSTVQQPILVKTEKPYISKNISSSVEEVSDKHNQPNIEIDDRMFVTELKTDNLEKKFNVLGKTTISKDESLSANVSKLASLKKPKEE
ncbi:hypothetical protein EBU71_06565 [bacterium]|jgi:hypothetical protein|nr:hypothetical protein [Candidatus Elulimicrobium humile]